MTKRKPARTRRGNPKPRLLNITDPEAVMTPDELQSLSADLAALARQRRRVAVEHAHDVVGGGL